MDKQIMVVDDDPDVLITIRQIFENEGYEVFTVDSGLDCIKELERGFRGIILMDIMMPFMDGLDTIIEIMKMGVFDYIIKPLDPDLFQKVINKSIEYKRLKDMENNLINTAALKIRNQLEWLNYKENRRITAKEYAEIKSIYNLKTSLTQGTGFGALLTVIDIILHSKKDEGKTYSIDKEMLDLLTENFDTCNAQLKGLHDISNLLENLFPVEASDAITLIGAIPGMLKDVLPYLEIKNLRITYPELKTNCGLNLNMETLSLIIEELAINAYKYSIANSTINMFAYIKEGYLWLCIMNEVSENPYGGIPQKYEKLILEPFFRLLPPDESIGRIEKFGLGLGLTVVDNITRKHGGLFLIHDVKDHTEEKIKISVLAEIMLPVVVD